MDLHFGKGRLTLKARGIEAGRSQVELRVDAVIRLVTGLLNLAIEPLMRAENAADLNAKGRGGVVIISCSGRRAAPGC